MPETNTERRNVADTKKVHMSETYVVQSGPLRGLNLFLNEVYEVDEQTAKEVKDAGVGNYTQKQTTSLGVNPLVVSSEPTSAPADADEAGSSK